FISLNFGFAFPSYDKHFGTIAAKGLLKKLTSSKVNDRISGRGSRASKFILILSRGQDILHRPNCLE
ncbi:hypothetical protein J6590_042272, partial [Homalodisca vitripennis]